MVLRRRRNMSFYLTAFAGSAASVITPTYFNRLHSGLALSQRGRAEMIYHPCLDAETATLSPMRETSYVFIWTDPQPGTSL